MTDLASEIDSIFQTKRVPGANQLVAMDGMDVLDKEAAVEFFSGKSSKDVLEYLRSRKFDASAGSDFQLEEWSVLEPSARYYYLRSYLQYLFETLSGNDPDGGYVSDIFHQLYQTVYMYGANAYSDDQETLLRKVSALTLETIKSRSSLHDSRDDIEDNVSAFLAELERRD